MYIWVCVDSLLGQLFGMLRLSFCAPHQNGSTNGLTQEWAVEVEAQNMVNRRKNLNLQSTRMWKNPTIKSV